MSEPILADSGDVLLDTLANHIQTLGLATVGLNLFVHRMPEAVQRGIVLLNNLNGSRVDPDIPNYRRGRFRLIARETTHKAAFALIQSVAPYLTLKMTKIDDVEFKYLTPENDPVIYPVSLGSNLLEIAIVFNTAYAIS